MANEHVCLVCVNQCGSFTFVPNFVVVMYTTVLKYLALLYFVPKGTIVITLYPDIWEGPDT